MLGLIVQLGGLDFLSLALFVESMKQLLDGSD